MSEPKNPLAEVEVPRRRLRARGQTCHNLELIKGGGSTSPVHVASSDSSHLGSPRREGCLAVALVS